MTALEIMICFRVTRDFGSSGSCANTGNVHQNNNNNNNNNPGFFMGPFSPEGVAPSRERLDTGHEVRIDRTCCRSEGGFLERVAGREDVMLRHWYRFNSPHGLLE